MSNEQTNRKTADELEAQTLLAAFTLDLNVAAMADIVGDLLATWWNLEDLLGPVSAWTVEHVYMAAAYMTTHGVDCTGTYEASAWTAPNAL